jgi:hypothetical protein
MLDCNDFASSVPRPTVILRTFESMRMLEGRGWSQKGIGVVSVMDAVLQDDLIKSILVYAVRLSNRQFTYEIV